MQALYPNPQGGASLVLSFRLQNDVVLILGSGPLAATRTFAALEADALVIVLAKGGIEGACDELKWRVSQKQVEFVDWDTLPAPSSNAGDEAVVLDAFLNKTPRITLAIVTDTLAYGFRRDEVSARMIYHVFESRNILVNMTDMPRLCDFSFTSSHRFEHADGTGRKTPLQIGITTNGHGCRLAARLRRELVAKLSKDAGAAVENVGVMRSMAMEEQQEITAEAVSEEPLEETVNRPLGEQPDVATEIVSEEEISEESRTPTPNRPVPSRNPSETTLDARKRRIKWVAQVSEYWALSKLAAMSESDMRQVLAGDDIPPIINGNDNETPRSSTLSRHFTSLPKAGRIFLVGSGPGHPLLLTLATHTALTQHADLVLSDKLVPDAVLAVIPKTVEVRIARKFPGNADGAQNEMMDAAVEAARKGLTVVRLKQGDPSVYGRAGEEILFFRSQGIEAVVIPGVSSALAGPTFAGIPVTQRGVAESLMVCTGVGRKGKEVRLPGYQRERTLLLLMGLARLGNIVDALVGSTKVLEEEESNKGRRDGPAYPPYTPIAIIERASMPDQRVIHSTLRDVVRALESSGEQRPPGMMVVGWSVLALWGEGDVKVLDENATEERDEERVQTWLGGVKWRVKEGLDEGWEAFES